MSLKGMKWALFIVPAVVIGGFETIRHTLLEQTLPMELGNWITACIDAAVIAIITRKIMIQFSKTEQELNQERTLRTILEERERLARVLHDQIAQSIFYSGIQINTSRKLAEDSGQSTLVEKLDDIRMSLREIDENVRQAIFNLKDNSADISDVPSRFRSYLSRVLDNTTITWRLNIDYIYQELTLAEQTQLFGILQETITNIIKHAHATEIHVSLVSLAEKNGRWIFEVSDNGDGFEAAKDQSRKFGMEIISNRARDIGAEVDVETGNNGTKISVIARSLF